MTNQVLPFLIHGTDMSGRLVQLNQVAQDIASRRAFPAPVQGLVAEATALAGGLHALLKFQGKLIVQVRGKGPVSMVVAHAEADGGLRATATVDTTRLQAYGKHTSFYALLGEGHVAFTLDRGGDFERTQGIVTLQRAGLAASLQHYFDQSDQVDLRVVSAARFRETGWVAGAILLQRLPMLGGGGAADSTAAGSRYGARAGAHLGQEDAAHRMWETALALLGTVTETELTDPNLSGQRLLYRLFHEQGVRVGEPQALQRTCACDRERFLVALRSLPQGDLDDVFAGGDASSTCEFCGTTFTATRADLGQTAL